jgi:hypothetical protein
VRVFRRDHFALFGQTDLPVHRAGRLREDRLVARAAAAPDRAAAAVEQAQRDAVVFAQRAEKLDQIDLGAVQLPVAGEAAAVLVAVGVAEHDVLLCAAAHHHGCDAGQRVEGPHDRCGVAQVADGFEQWRDDQIRDRA